MVMAVNKALVNIYLQLLIHELMKAEKLFIFYCQI